MSRYNSNVWTPFETHAGKVDHLHGDAFVDVGSSGYPFTSIQTAINSITDASASKRYDVRIHPGTYHETITTKDYVNLIGDSPLNCIIDYDSGDPANEINYSTIFLTSTTLIQNLWIKTTNSKYPIHSDVSAGAYHSYVRNCILQHMGSTDGSMASGTCFGIGLYQGQYVEIYDSTLIAFNTANDVGAAGVYFHNQSDAGGFRSFRAENNNIQNAAYGFRVNALAGTGANQSNDAYLIGNTIQAYTSDIFYDAASTDLAWNIKAHGNNIRRVSRNSNTYIVEEPGFTKRLRFVSATTKGSVIVLYGSHYVALGATTTTMDSGLVVGVLLEDVAVNATGRVQVRGWVDNVKVNGAIAVADLDPLGTYSVASVSYKSTTNPFAIAKGAYATADSNGLIPAILTRTVWD